MLQVNSLRPRPNKRHFADDIFKCIFENENEWISPGISLKFVPKVQINNIPALVHIMAWRRPGDKPLSEPMMIISLTHICVTRPQWVNFMSICEIVLRWMPQKTFDDKSTLVQLMACSCIENPELLWYQLFSSLEALWVVFITTLVPAVMTKLASWQFPVLVIFTPWPFRPKGYCRLVGCFKI